MRGGLAARRDLQPGDLREGDPRLDRLRRADSRSSPSEGLDARRIYEEIAIHDVQMACDVLRPVWDEADGADGSCRSRSSPRVAHDTDGRIEQARDFWRRVDRPNLMIKIPGTEEGVPAIEEAIAAGINVNVTLLFSRRVLRRRSPRPTSAAWSGGSTRASPLDVALGGELLRLARGHRGRQAPGGARARGPARRSRRSPTRAPPTSASRSCSLGERFARCATAGAPVQRPLWASTGVKDPRYSGDQVRRRLVAPHTVNTMPMPTLLACAEQLEVHGRHRRPGPDRRPAGARRRRHRHGRRDRRSCSTRASRSSSSRSTS